MGYFRQDSPIEAAYLASARVAEGVVSRAEYQAWQQRNLEATPFEVRRIPFAELGEWLFEPDTSNLYHRTGKFFRIEGLDVRTNFGPTPHWQQPIVVQPEIGIVGFLTQKHNGILHFLINAKLEPGNVNILQIAPTVQATRSNYTGAHGGKAIRFLEYFLDPSRARVRFHQLQSEQGSRFLRKRNRNMIVEADPSEKIAVPPDFCWVTLGQLDELFAVPNLINMETRNLLSSLRFPVGLLQGREPASFAEHVLKSATAEETEAEHDLDTLLSWLTYLKSEYELEVRRIPLGAVEHWSIGAEAIRQEQGRYFEVVAVAVRVGNREVGGWRQPLLAAPPGGIVAFLCQVRGGVLHFLVQGRVEPGNLDVIELAPTVQCTPSNYDERCPESLPPFYAQLRDAAPGQVRLDVLQSEEGGRFYHVQNRHVVVEIPPDQALPLPGNYIWMTLRQMKEIVRFNNHFNIEARGVIACLGRLAGNAR